MSDRSIIESGAIVITGLAAAILAYEYAKHKFATRQASVTVVAPSSQSVTASQLGNGYTAMFGAGVNTTSNAGNVLSYVAS